jgi:hypothetical protein
MKWRYRTSSVEAWTEGGVGHYVLTGVITSREVRSVLRDAADWQAYARAPVVVRDLSKALCSAPLRDYLNETFDVMAAACPAVIIPSPGQEAYYRAFATALCQKGIGRAVRRDYRSALGWAREIAALRSLDAWRQEPLDSATSLAPANATGTHRSGPQPA